MRVCHSRLFAFCALISLVSLFLATAAWGQASYTAQVRGVVKDQTGAMVAQATLTIVNDATGITATAHSDEHGLYILTGLRPAVYTIKAEMNGFRPTEEKNVVLQVDQQNVDRFCAAPARSDHDRRSDGGRAAARYRERCDRAKWPQAIHKISTDASKPDDTDRFTAQRQVRCADHRRSIALGTQRLGEAPRCPNKQHHGKFRHRSRISSQSCRCIRYPNAEAARSIYIDGFESRTHRLHEF